ncbi:hypothetical protein TGPRC2_271025 [Toxoplasma gondii TgCatPRC2]|uniref:Uncharacterized protein n=3 Tax=Toxoplasma gondii TaxID=5811 RepID=A0A151HPE2_TOXGO|nr:hypothetical protein TGME49_271025 [Toxoplasma gondii ME49]EPT28473.1 hypothetical protein TGME49_271025 [Toxoplasma gondii ME49]KYF46872.1 hypothetical protein TGARI_271025 [Toxoplasma gondii ARI]KYK71114.1 hypothetical protein TGPRC2_271025 [Toxoplasma gondii TgCatPRC2]|eukprot:XP_018636635.1 hypothetical protein TGME49_271025 [Toxoplasma gondii ME49]
MAVVSHTGEIPALPEHRTLCRRLVQGGRGGDSLQLPRRAKKRKTQQARVQGEKKMKTHEDEEQEAPFPNGPLHGVETTCAETTTRTRTTSLSAFTAALFHAVEGLDSGSPKDFVRSLLIPSTQQAAASRVPPVAVVCDATGGQGAAALCFLECQENRNLTTPACVPRVQSRSHSTTQVFPRLRLLDVSSALLSTWCILAKGCEKAFPDTAHPEEFLLSDSPQLMFQHPLLGVASCGFPLLLAPPSPPWAQWRHRLASRLEAGSVLMTPVRILLLGRCTFLCHAMMHTQHPPNRLRDLSRARKFHFRLCFLHPRF